MASRGGGVSASTLKGAVAEAAIAAAAIELGIYVWRPMVEGRRYDLVFDVDDRLYRVQCKWAPRRGSVVAVNLTACRHIRAVTFGRRTAGTR